MIDTTRVTGGNHEAAHFLAAWGLYLRRVDDSVDTPDWSAENLIAAFALGAACYSSNFYRRHVAQLQMPILVATNLWCLSNEWEKEPELYKRTNADVLRNADVMLLNAVCQICVGWEPAIDASRALLASAHIQHLDKHGPI